MEIPKGQEQDGTRRLMISIENRNLGDEVFGPSIRKALETYLKLMADGKAGHNSVEVLASHDGTTMVVTHVSSLASYILLEDPGVLVVEMD